VLKGFRDFILRGNVIELAVAVVIGTAFNNVVTSFTKSFIEPLIRLISGGKQVSGTITLSGKAGTPDAIALDYGGFINAILTFLITAAVVYFLMILPMNKWKERQAARKPAEDSPLALTEVELLTQIRDALIAQRIPAPSAPSATSGSIGTQKTHE